MLVQKNEMNSDFWLTPLYIVESEKAMNLAPLYPDNVFLPSVLARLLHTK